jgi:hypothetical protein
VSSDYCGPTARETADAREVNEQLRSLAVLRRYPAALRYAEDFEREWRATVNDPEGRAALTLAYRQEQAHGEACGGWRCCGSAGEWHNPWCEYGPRRHREAGREEWDADRDEKDMDPHYYDGADDG